MNWFKRKKASSSEMENSAIGTHALNPQMEKFERIFIEKEEPANQARPSQATNIEPTEASSKSSLLLFLNTDYDQQGYSDGYNFHSERYLELKVEELQGDCLMYLESEINRLQAEAYNLTTQIRSYRSEDFIELRDQLELRHEQVHEAIGKYVAQKDMVAVGQGFLQKPIAKYKAGYFKGVFQYQELEILSKPLTIL
ncbi:MAG: hypothetical protein RIF36_08080 [Imperialibacter sp.]|uniref:hypothetical protein n=1 Tax=Imperialibacter sp. TaxID=2038411 RepID=UPI0032EFC758